MCSVVARVQQPDNRGDHQRGCQQRRFKVGLTHWLVFRILAFGQISLGPSRPASLSIRWFSMPVTLVSIKEPFRTPFFKPAGVDHMTTLFLGTGTSFLPVYSSYLGAEYGP